jgi:hypothetical protein
MVLLFKFTTGTCSNKWHCEFIGFAWLNILNHGILPISQKLTGGNSARLYERQLCPVTGKRRHGVGGKEDSLQECQTVASSKYGKVICPPIWFNRLV